MLDCLTQANFKNFNNPWIESVNRTFNKLTCAPLVKTEIKLT